MLSVFEVVALPTVLDPFVIGLLLSIATILIVSKLGSATEAERSYRAMIHQIPSGEIDERKLKQTARISKGLALTGAATIAVMVVFYARPYAAGRAALESTTAALEHGSGELLVAIAYGGVMILVGAIAYRFVKRDYALKFRRDEEE
jgi:hypothetical protein